MSKWFGRIAWLFSNRSMVGRDKAGNRYFTRKDEVDGISKWLSHSCPCLCFHCSLIHGFCLDYHYGHCCVISLKFSNWVFIIVHCTSNLLHGGFKETV